MTLRDCGTCSLGQGSKPKGAAAGLIRVKEFRYPVADTIGAGIGAVLSKSLTTHSDSYFVVTKLIASAAGTFLTQIQDTGSGVILMDAPIAQANLWGIAQRPNYLKDPLIIPPSSTVLLNLTNGIAGANAFQLVLEGYKHYDLKNPPQPLGKAPVRPFSGTEKWFMYSANISLLGLAAGTVQTRIQNDANFVIRKYLASSTGNFQVRLSDTGDQAEWMDGYVQRDNLFGTAQYPAVLTKPRTLRRNSTVQVEVADLSGAPNVIQIVFEGVKVYV
jgi:hypothetical protein